MNDDPLVSFVVLSYNYEEHIRTTLRSILDQTFADFEVVVVDDCSRDGSLDSIRSFDDPRVRLIQNERNQGGSVSFNRGVEAARGEWIVNLDADDWIAPEKTAKQLDIARTVPSLSIIGTWVHVVDESGQRHPKEGALESFVNRPHLLNSVRTWVGQNPLCRSSTMVRRSLYQEIGGSDPEMVRAPDYELWTRALSRGHRFHVVPEPLTYYRLHSGGVTHGDPVGTALELAYATIRNLAPLAEAQGLYDDWASMLRWLVRGTEDGGIGPAESLRLRGMVVLLPVLTDFAAFRALLATPDALLERIGRHTLASSHGVTNDEVEKLQSANDAFLEARDFWQAQATAREEEIEKLRSDIRAFLDARDFWHAQATAWEARYWASTGLEPS